MALRATPGTVASNRINVFKPSGTMVTIADAATSTLELNDKTIFRCSATGAIVVTITNGGAAFPMSDGSIEYVELDADQQFSVAVDT